MRCPRCHRVEPVSAEACSSCGFELSAIQEADAHMNICPDRAPSSPLQDFELTGPSAVRPTARRTTSSLPLTRPLSVGCRALKIPKLQTQKSALPLGTPQVLPTYGRGFTSSTTAADCENQPSYLLGRRFAAAVVDTLILANINNVVVYLTLRMVGLGLSDVGSLPVVPLTCFLLLFDATYFVMLTAFGGQTIGRMAVGLRVEKRGGHTVPMVGALVRTMCYAASIVPVGLGFVSLFLGSRRTLHDLVTDTMVVRVS